MTFLFTLFCTGCFEKSNDDTAVTEDTASIDCSAEFVYSLNLTLTDPDGQPLVDANISYTVDGEEGTFVEVVQEGEYVVGGEEAGLFEVNISAEVPLEDDPLCWNVGEATLSVEVLENECHVIPQRLEPELEWILVCQ